MKGLYNKVKSGNKAVPYFARATMDRVRNIIGTLNKQARQAASRAADQRQREEVEAAEAQAAGDRAKADAELAKKQKEKALKIARRHGFRDDQASALPEDDHGTTGKFNCFCSLAFSTTH